MCIWLHDEFGDCYLEKRVKKCKKYYGCPDKITTDEAREIVKKYKLMIVGEEQ